MPIDLYSQKPTQVLQKAGGQQIQRGKALASKMIGGQAIAGLEKGLQYGGRRLNEAIQAWGTDTLINWEENSAKIIDAVQQDMQQLRHTAQMARQQNDMEMYKNAMQRILFDKKMLAYANQLKKARIGNIITGIVTGLGNLSLLGFLRKEEE